MATRLAPRSSTESVIEKMSKQQISAYNMSFRVPTSLDALPLVPALQSDCIKLAASLPPLPALPPTIYPQEGSPYVPPRWRYGYVYSIELALEANMARAPEKKKIPPAACFEKRCDKSVNIERERAYLAIRWVFNRVSEILEHTNEVALVQVWDEGRPAQMLAYGDTWDLGEAPSDEQMAEISHLLFGEWKEPMWFLCRRHCLWRVANY
ncbi:hypothetical protein GLOTRDRAFT_128243 [Gloeophyllum trabeum ATCC 11539]|uniref:Uncharacterized protein n=1 Tax=Gloeophyllum trabeum (strain ATCC 11539 / FP-39264 / Madison 617) TaxID=670483 RepID=S7QBQ1_GLOTA|nr:uncharacterized protein GLOTRDRAFT_128243 [Gloeophyllum trabeum ATCC 11539]EPQ56782.1 hypothetical protein GLOTRDRAFT_128243 [Gloeophyllum trabeum ATCC 11539]